MVTILMMKTMRMTIMTPIMTILIITMVIVMITTMIILIMTFSHYVAYFRERYHVLTKKIGSTEKSVPIEEKQVLRVQSNHQVTRIPYTLPKKNKYLVQQNNRYVVCPVVSTFVECAHKGASGKGTGKVKGS